ncbi:hypothetical protein MCOR25_006542 [Pyricularia grisea]|uniref:Uncharacterized protein n=1 Tax=Pyricularia grisea TaxID=148305 RepID=A0A6P8B3N2_PYRGI|nr:hypothetical protein PgNI_06468 [Pyricularia grisea]KAI6361171.1 hypothetical protein MCOR25_006542 [Pyricularia grisea]TLD09951.1 hypothetical protein PgNI_06468 [Pyricularia grisea]
MLASLQSLALSLSLLVATTAAQSNLVASHFNGNVYSLAFSGSQLTLKQTLKAGGTWPAWVTYDNDTRTVYVNDEAGWIAPTITALSVSADGTLAQTAAARSNGEVYSGLYGGADGKGFIAVVQYENSGIWTYKLPITSSSQPIQKLGPWTMTSPGPNPSRQNKPHPHSAFPDPTGRFLLTGDLGADLIRVFSIDSTSGQLTSCADVKTGAGDGPRHGTFFTSGNSTVLYMVNELANTVTTYRVGYPSTAGGCLTLTKAQSISTMGPGKTPPAGSKAAAVQLVGGRHLYVTNRNDKTFGAQQDAIALYSVSPTDGQLTFVETSNSHAFFPRTMQANKAGTMLAVGGQTSSNVVVLERDAQSGRLGRVLANLVVGTLGRAGEEDGLSAVVWVE